MHAVNATDVCNGRRKAPLYLHVMELIAELENRDGRRDWA